MNRDPVVSSRLHAVDEAWPVDEAEQLRRFEAARPSRGTPRRSDRARVDRTRVATAAVAFAVFALGSVLAWRAFYPGGGPAPAATPAPQVSIQASLSTFDVGLHFLEGAVVADGSVWVAGSDGDSQEGQLVRVDPATGDVLARINVPVPGWEFGGADITAARGSVWIAAGPYLSPKKDLSGGWLYRIDPSTDSVADSVRIGDAFPADLWVDDSGIWILSSAGSDAMTVSRLDPTTYAVVQSTRLDTSWSQTIAVSGGHVWVFGSTQGDAPAETLFELDPQTLALTDTIQPTDGRSFFLAVSGDRIWFHERGLRALDASSGQQIIGPLGQVNDCCAALNPDGAGGIWVLDPRGARGLWHADANGTVDRVDDEHLGPKVDGNASTFDPGSDSIWVLRSSSSVTGPDGELVRVQISTNDVSPTGSGAPVLADALTASCGGATIEELPLDTSSLTPYASFDELDLSQVGGEAPYFQDFVSRYDWFVTDEGDNWRELFGEPTEPGGDPPYASLRIEMRDGRWAPVGWGRCRIELSAPGWGNASFQIDPKSPPSATSDRVLVQATENACASGQVPTDRQVQAVILDETERSVSIVILVEPTSGGADCQSNPSFPFEVDLGSPLGDRTIIDASVYPPVQQWPQTSRALAHPAD